MVAENRGLSVGVLKEATERLLTADKLHYIGGCFQNRNLTEDDRDTL
jgi:hypothetical protein